MLIIKKVTSSTEKGVIPKENVLFCLVTIENRQFLAIINNGTLISNYFMKHEGKYIYIYIYRIPLNHNMIE